MWFLTWVGNLLAGPFVKGVLDGYKAKLEAGNTTERIAAELAGREIDVQRRELELQHELRKAQIGVWWEPEKLMGYAVAIYVAKLLVYDKVFGLGSTDPLVGWVETTANLIIAFYFGKRTITDAIRLIKR